MAKWSCASSLFHRNLKHTKIIKWLDPCSSHTNLMKMASSPELLIFRREFKARYVPLHLTHVWVVCNSFTDPSKEFAVEWKQYEF
jgi:hypothetical protein